MCGLSGSAASTGAMNCAGNSEGIDVPTNSVPTVALTGSAKSALTSWTQLEWMSPQAVAARLIGPVLSCVERADLHQRPDGETAVQLHVWAGRKRLPAQRHVLVVRAIRVRAPREKPARATLSSEMDPA
jgi:hypothetical protein